MPITQDLAAVQSTCVSNSSTFFNPRAFPLVSLSVLNWISYYLEERITVTSTS